MRSEIGRMTLEKTFGEQGTLSQAGVRIVNEAARDQECNGDAGGSRSPQTCGDLAEVKETSRAKSIWHEDQQD